MDYILWGISYPNLEFLLADSVSVFYGKDKSTGKKGSFHKEGMNLSSFIKTMKQI